MNNKRLLDFGCGQGDFYPFIKKIYPKVKYTGIDINPRFVNVAQKRFPKAKFRVGTTSDIKNSYDYIVCSGVFSFTVDNYWKLLCKSIAALYSKSKIALGFNLLELGKHIDNEIYVTYNKDKVIKHCNNLSNKVKLIDGYLDYDFTTILYKR